MIFFKNLVKLLDTSMYSRITFIVVSVVSVLLAIILPARLFSAMEKTIIVVFVFIIGNFSVFLCAAMTATTKRIKLHSRGQNEEISQTGNL